MHKSNSTVMRILIESYVINLSTQVITEKCKLPMLRDCPGWISRPTPVQTREDEVLSHPPKTPNVMSLC